VAAVTLRIYLSKIAIKLIRMLIPLKQEVMQQEILQMNYGMWLSVMNNNIQVKNMDCILKMVLSILIYGCKIFLKVDHMY